MYLDMDLEWFEDGMNEDDYYGVTKKNRRAKRDKIDRSKELFMKLNGKGLITDVLPTIAQRAKKEREK